MSERRRPAVVAFDEPRELGVHRVFQRRVEAVAHRREGDVRVEPLADKALRGPQRHLSNAVLPAAEENTLASAFEKSRDARLAPRGRRPFDESDPRKTRRRFDRQRENLEGPEREAGKHRQIGIYVVGVASRESVDRGVDVVEKRRASEMGVANVSLGRGGRIDVSPRTEHEGELSSGAAPPTALPVGSVARAVDENDDRALAGSSGRERDPRVGMARNRECFEKSGQGWESRRSIAGQGVWERLARRLWSGARRRSGACARERRGGRKNAALRGVIATGKDQQGSAGERE